MSKTILRNLCKNADYHDPLVGGLWYKKKLHDLNMNDKSINKFYKNFNKNYLGMLAVVRSEQLGLINKITMYQIINNKQTDYEIDMIIKNVQNELNRLIDVEYLKLISNYDPNLFNIALYLKIKGVDKYDIYFDE